MPSRPKIRVSRTTRGGAWLEPESLGRRAPVTRALFNPSSAESMAALHRTLNGDPEVMVKVTGGGRDTGTAQAHISYIDRHGELDIVTDYGDILSGKDAAKELIDDWDLDMRKDGKAKVKKEQTGKVDYRTKKVHNIVLSMPSGTPPQAVLKAAERFARENFAFSHRYAMVLHDPATDPKHEKTQSGRNPHVHLVVKAVSKTGERLVIRKPTLQTWREQFAEALREQGIKANATPAAIRGKPKSSAKSAIHQHQARLDSWRSEAHSGDIIRPAPVESAWEITRVSRVIDELVNGHQPDPTGKGKLKTTRQSVIEDWQATEKALRAAGKGQDAERVRTFINNMQPVKTAHEETKDYVLANQDRLKAAVGHLVAEKGDARNIMQNNAPAADHGRDSDERGFSR